MSRKSRSRAKRRDDRVQMNIRLSAKLKEELVGAARRRGMKLQDYVVKLITWARKERKAQNAKRKKAETSGVTQ